MSSKTKDVLQLVEAVLRIALLLVALANVISC